MGGTQFGGRGRLAAVLTVIVLSASAAAAPAAIAAARTGAGGRSAPVVGARALIPHPVSGQPLSWLPAPARTRFAAVLSHTAAMRRALAGGRLLAMVESMYTSRGAPAVAVPALPAPSAADRARVRSLPVELRAPVAGLYSAVEEAGRLLGDLPAAEFHRELGELLGGRRLPLPEPSLPASRLGPGLTASAPRPELRTLLGAVQPGAATLRAIAEAPTATVLIAAALDRYLPRLRAAARQLENRGGTAVDGCDLLDETPYLCVGSSADNTYTQDEMLLIDLGGNNTFDNSAGGAPFLPAANAPAAIPVSVSVAVGSGSDSYFAPVETPQRDAFGNQIVQGLVLGQGAGMFGAVGFLYDGEGGPNRFLAGSPELPPLSGTLLKEYAAIAQGAGALGTGLLVDDGGDASFRMTGPGTANPAVNDVIGQGAAEYTARDGCDLYDDEFCALGGLLTLGGGNDSYQLDGGRYDVSGYSSDVGGVAGQGVGMGIGNSAGFLLDDGGDDTFTVGIEGSIDDHTRPLSPFCCSPYLVADAQGVGEALGNGFLLEGPGDHSYTIDSTGHGLGVFTGEVAGQGYGGYLGVGVLQDRGSRADYALRESVTDAHTFTVADGCSCPAKVDINGVYADGGFSHVALYGQGAAWGGLGLLDNAGAASYDAAMVQDINDRLVDQRADPATPAELDVMGLREGSFVAQGTQIPDVSPTGGLGDSESLGLLVNRKGHATYSALDQDTVEASGVSTNGRAPTVSAATPFSVSFGGAQGAGGWNPYGSVALGALLDLGGPDDTFTVTQTHAVTTSPDTGNDYASGFNWLPSQADGDGGLFVTTSPDPVVVSHPVNGVCPVSLQPAYSGFGSWLSCGFYAEPGQNPDTVTVDDTYPFQPGYGVGEAQGATGTAPQLSVTSPSTVFDGGLIPVTVMLRDAAGKPIAGATVHVDLQIAGSLTAPPMYQWLNVTQAEGVTGADGSARIDLRCAVNRLTGLTSLAGWGGEQVAATYDGAPGRYPRHVASPIVVVMKTPTGSVPEAPLTVALVLVGGLLASGGLLRAGRRSR